MSAPYATEDDEDSQLTSRSQKYNKQRPVERPPTSTPTQRIFEKMRKTILSRGRSCGINAFGRTFRIYDRDGSRSLSKEEFKIGCQKYGIDLSDKEIATCFTELDRDGSGTVDFDELLAQLRPPMSKARMDLILKAFSMMDKTGDGIVTMADLKGVYDHTHHPKFKSGEWTQRQVFTEFLKTYQVGDEIDDKVTREEFINYYAGVSNSVDTDVYFDYMMRQTWKNI